MKFKSFKDYVILKEGDESKSSGIRQEITLGKDNEYEPFMIGNGVRANLGLLVKAFQNADEVEFGPKTIESKTTLQSGEQKGSGLTRNKLKKKNLYLVGGAVRDHLRGETPTNYNLVTDATIDEIRLILQNSGFTEVSPPDNEDDEPEVDRSKYEHLPKSATNQKKFWVKGHDSKGEEYAVDIKINGEKFEISTLHKHSKGKQTNGKKELEFTPKIEDDAAKRDFTINAMYIPLTNDKGPNNKLIDVHGGLMDLRNSRVRFVGNPKERLEEDQMRAPRYARFAAELGDKNIPKEYKDAIAAVADLPILKSLNKATGKDGKKKLKTEFLKGLQKTKMDPKTYVFLYQQLGLLKTVFPNMNIKLDGPDDMTDKKEKHLAIAWILRKNDPDKVYDMLIDGKWSKDEAKRIRFLIGFLNFSPDVGPEDLDKFANAFSKSGFSTGYLNGKPMGKKSHLATWADMNKDKFKTNYEHEDWKKAIDAFLQHMSIGEVKPNEDNPDFEEGYSLDPIDHSIKETPRLGQIKNELAYQRFRDILMGIKPKNV